MPYQPTLNQNKFEQLLLHIAERSVDDPAFGKTKLNKILYYIDFNAFGLLGHSITGATYQHRPYGPVPKEISTVRAALIAQSRAYLQPALSFGYSQDRLVAKEAADLTVFERAELDIIDAVVSWLRTYSAKRVSDMSHREFGYRTTKNGDVIAYESAYISAEGPTPDDHARADEIWAYLFEEGPAPTPVRVTAVVAA